MKNINKISLGLVLIVILIFIVIVSAYIGQKSQLNQNQINNYCYHEERFLKGQYIINTMYCQDCLHFETTINNRTMYLFFADEHKINKKIQSNKSIIINWCYIDGLYEYRIRGIWNK